MLTKVLSSKKSDFKNNFHGKIMKELEIYDSKFLKEQRKKYKEKFSFFEFEEIFDQNEIYKKFLNFLNDKENLFVSEENYFNYWINRVFLDSTENEGKNCCLIIFSAILGLNENNCLSDSWIKKLINEGFNPKNILFVGTRFQTPSEVEKIKELGIKIIYLENLLFNIEGYTDYIMEFTQNRQISLCLNLDFLDPVFAPGVNNRIPGGFNSAHLFYVIKRLKRLKNLNIFTINGLNFSKDYDCITSNLVSKIIFELI